jgi:6-aminohexanoate-oligomer endohydrolase
MDNNEENNACSRREFLQGSLSAGIVSASGGFLGLEDAVMADDAIVTNDTRRLVPLTDIKGRSLSFDFPALHIGIAEYAEGPTGCTVFHFPKGAMGAVDVRGGSSGTIMAGDGPLDALCYAGGSLYGLEAATGVAAEIFAVQRYSTQWFNIGLVRGAIIYDYPPRKNAVYPDKALGRAALKAAKSGTFLLGQHGAGISATVGKGFDYDLGERGGQGGAFRQVGPTKVAFFSVVNALGAIVDKQGRVVRGHLDRKTGKRLSVTEILDRKIASPEPPKPASGNTTLSVVVTNQKLGPHELGQMAKQVHGSLSRVIQPFHGLEDGDVLYAVTTNEVENTALPSPALSVLASELAWDAVLTCFDK